MIEMKARMRASADDKINSSVPSIPTNYRMMILPEDEEEMENIRRHMHEMERKASCDSS